MQIVLISILYFIYNATQIRIAPNTLRNRFVSNNLHFKLALYLRTNPKFAGFHALQVKKCTFSASQYV